jgi:hypothetical protein
MARDVPTPIQQVLDEIEKLAPQDQQVVLDIVQRRLVERRRAEIAQNARAAVQAFREGRAQYGSVIVLGDIGTHEEVY